MCACSLTTKSTDLLLRISCEILQSNRKMSHAVQVMSNDGALVSGKLYKMPKMRCSLKRKGRNKRIQKKREIAKWIVFSLEKKNLEKKKRITSDTIALLPLNKLAISLRIHHRIIEYSKYSGKFS